MSLPPLHVVTDDAVLGRADFADAARDVLAAGGPRLALHLRGPGSSAARLHDLAVALLEHARRSGALLLVNDRVDLALALPLDGVQLGERSLPVAVARRLLGPRWIGRSVHGAPAALEGKEGGADFLVVGTVFASASHPEREPAGPARIREMRGLVDLPLLAIGGVTPGRVAEVLEAGASGAAVLSGVWDAPEPPRAVEGYLQALASAERRAAGGPPSP